MKAKQIRQKYLNFFKAKGHAIIPSAPLIPEHDPTVLFTTAGMHPLVPYLLGQKHPMGNRLANIQKCIRTSDIEEVGDSTHLTFFEMLGNWSLGDYFKKEAISWSFEFLTKKLKIPIEKLAISVFKGDKNIPRDIESAKIWQSLGIPKKRIAYLGRKDNWWGPAGKTGPCGPDTEMFYWIGKTKLPKKFDPTNKHWIEIWNNVFMEYNKTAKGKYQPLKQKNVDTGMGLERITAVLQNKNSVYETSLFKTIIEKIKQIQPEIKKRQLQIVADHVKAAVFIIADGAKPSNTNQGYVVRRLIRRAMRYCKNIIPVAEEVIKIYRDTYQKIKEPIVLESIQKEQEKFAKCLEKGLKEFKKINGDISGKQAFDLYQSYGFPIEMTKELAQEKNVSVDIKDFKKRSKKHQKLSRQAACGKFKAGLADHQNKTINLHTATHLLLQALRQILGNHVKQAGSNINPKRLRFDFTHKKKLTDKQLKKIENLVNQKIKAGLPIKCQEMPLKRAEKSGALANFKTRYPDIVRVYQIGNFSKEICAGPHAKNTADLGKFKIIQEKSSSAGVRRIKAILK